MAAYASGVIDWLTNTIFLLCYTRAVASTDASAVVLMVQIRLKAFEG